jgi:hypothetical protein
MAVLDDLNAAYANVAAQLNSMTINPKPTYSVDGVSYSWGQHFEDLTNQSMVIEQMIQRASGPFQIPTRAVT